MININILLPWEKKRIIEEVSKKLEQEYGKGVKKHAFNHVGDAKFSLYVWLQDDTPLYITAKYYDIAGTMTISDDMSF